MNKFKILFVGGTWTPELTTNAKHKSYKTTIDDNTSTTQSDYGCASGLVSKIEKLLQPYISYAEIYNGGDFNRIEKILNKAPNFDIVFWWPNIDNSLPKMRDVKSVAPHVMLVTSKRNDNNKYSFQELNQKALASKSNLVFEFSKIEPIVTPALNATPTFNVNIFDPLGCCWYNGIDLEKAILGAMNRLDYLNSITRQKTTKIDTSKGLVLSWFFDQFKQNEYQSDKRINIPDEQDFVNTVRKYATIFQTFMPTDCKTTRFVGNASLRPPQVGRCGKGMPSFRKNDYIFVSKRNIDKQFIELENFVPVYLDDDKLYYCGDDKPSVDTPIQVRLYKSLPNINYMLHSHCYIENAIFTTKAIPCGAIEEFDEIINTFNTNGMALDKNVYVLNLKGHGAIIMFNNMDQFHTEIEPTLKYIPRKLPELM